MPSRRKSLKKSAVEILKNYSRMARSNLATSFFQKVERGGMEFSSTDFASARDHLATVLRGISSLPGFALMTEHVESIIDSAIDGCRTTKELHQLCASILSLNQPREETKPPPSLFGR